MPDEAPILEMQQINKIYGEGDVQVHALKDIDLQVRQGEFVSIMGPSGSGKSTMMNILGALDQPTSGTYYLAGEDVETLDEAELARVRNEEVGFVFQGYNLLARTSAREQVEMPLIYADDDENRTERAEAALEQVGLGDRLDHMPTELSGGQQQRVAIARALVNQPTMILADEATGNLDSESGIGVLKLFQRLNKEEGITVVFVTHDAWTARHSQRIVMLRDGEVRADKPIPNPLVAGEAERPSESEELAGILEENE